MNCGDCRFFLPDDRQVKQGFCHFGPPEVLGEAATDLVGRQGVQLRGVWPPVTIDAWCGQFEQRIDA